MILVSFVASGSGSGAVNSQFMRQIATKLWPATENINKNVKLNNSSTPGVHVVRNSSGGNVYKFNDLFGKIITQFIQQSSGKEIFELLFTKVRSATED